MGEYKDSAKIEEIKFKLYTNEDIDKLSVLEITSEHSLNTLGHIVKGGLCDLRLGPSSSQKHDICETCSQNSENCPGHFGHMELAVPVFNPSFTDVVKKILSKTCIFCFSMTISKLNSLQLIYQQKLLEDGYPLQALDVEVIARSKCLDTDGSSAKMDTSENISEIEVHDRLNKFLKTVRKSGKQCPKGTTITNAVLSEIRNEFKVYCKEKKLCHECRKPIMKVSYQYSKFNVTNREELAREMSDEPSTHFNAGQNYITPKQVLSIMRDVWKHNSLLLGAVFPFLKHIKTEHPTDVFFMTKVIVTPPRFRPFNKLGALVIEHDLTILYKKLLQTSMSLKILAIHDKDGIANKETESILSIFGKDTTKEQRMQRFWSSLQEQVSNLLDSPPSDSLNVTAEKGFRQIVEKKAGLVRQNLMGKRVNFSARSVAAPDPYLCVDEVGVPQSFAMHLTYPVPVTTWNVDYLRELVINGAHIYPGAVKIINDDGRVISLTSLSKSQRTGHANKLLAPSSLSEGKTSAKTVLRHLQDGDFVLMNRQPTLHKSSIQAHKARVMANDRVLRMPYANCKAYNADFDGDELNLHFPQSELARSEAKSIVTSQNQYLTARDGTPLAGLIQDCIVATVMMTMRGKFFNKEDYLQLVYVALSDVQTPIKIQPPTILKPKQLWSGKQAISTIMHNIIPANKAKPSFTFRTQVKVEMWQNRAPKENAWKGNGIPETRKESMTDSELIMRDGDLLCGVIDKCAIGSVSHGLIHMCYDLYGGGVAANLLTCINRLCVEYLQWSGHTISTHEFVTKPSVAADRRKALRTLMDSCAEKAAEKLGIDESQLSAHIEQIHVSGNQKEMELVDRAYNTVLNGPTSQIIKDNEMKLYRPTLDNNMKKMVDTGAKGSKINMNQMASLFGSIAIDGQRMPTTFSGKTLPVYTPYDTDPTAGGYIPQRFMTGMDLNSFFYLSVVGRDSLQHTAVKTANSGYVQRCLIKHLEGISVQYDGTVRNSDGMVLQFQYGEDGQDVVKMPFLTNNHSLDVLMDNYSKLVDEKSKEISLSAGQDNEAIRKHKKKAKKWLKKGNAEKRRDSAFLQFCKHRSADFDDGRSLVHKNQTLLKTWISLSGEKKAIYEEWVTSKRPNPVSSVYCGNANIEAVTEAMDDFIDNYYDEHYSKRPQWLQPQTRSQVRQTLYLKNLHSKVDPGEAVGALCAQALGEPLTQMTLNTFHFAGRDELNVTLGVPRMIEILRTASKNISTPIMEVPFLPHVTEKMTRKLQKKLTPIKFSEILLQVDIAPTMRQQFGKKLYKEAVLKFSFLPEKKYKKLYLLTHKQLSNFFEDEFMAILMKTLETAVSGKKSGSNLGATVKRINEKHEEVLENRESEDVKELEEARESDESENEQLEDEKVAKEEFDYSDVESGNESVSENEDDIKDILPKSEDLNTENLDDVVTQIQKSAVTSAKSHDELNVKRIGNVKRHSTLVLGFNYDTENYDWCEVTLGLPVVDGQHDLASVLRKCVSVSYVRQLKELKKVCVVKKDEHFLLRTEGVNFDKMFEFSHMLDVDKIYSNNISLIREKYGVEAAQRSIIKEIRAVQSAYDITVDFRHLSLLADYFTCEGVYQACSRGAMKNCPSPIQSMTYETFFNVLKGSLINDQCDDMGSPSSQVMLGNTVSVGTNAMNIFYDTSVAAQ